MKTRAARSPWSFILAAYGLYAILALLNDITGANLLLVGSSLLLATLAALAAPQLMPIPLSGLMVALLLAVLGPVIAWLAGVTSVAAGSMTYVIKYFSLLFVVAAAEVLRLVPLYRVRERHWVFALLLAILIIGWWWGEPAEVSEERVEGIFTNPNNFALAAMSLLFFLDHARDTRRWIVGLYALVFGLILLSGTAGALLGFLAGVGVILLRSKSGRLACAAAALAAAAFLLLPGILPKGRVESLDEQRMIGPVWTKWVVTREHFADLAAGEDINFWEIGQQHGGAELTSALWRLWHWRETYRVFNESDWPSKLLGFGLGASSVRMGQLPHNDYLRLLFEVGYLGLAAQLAVWGILFRRADPLVHSPAAMIAVYMFTENNLDNFLVMSLFALFMVSARRRPAPPPVAPPPESAPL